MKQILLITDGCSNVGVEPSIAAAQVYRAGVIVNVVGVVDRESPMERGGAEEIGAIAKAGGGMSRIVAAAQLSQTVQMMTRKTVAQTIQQVVQRELRQIVGDGSIDALHPAKRAKVVQVMEDLGETTSLTVVLLIDSSGSMKPKIPAVQEAIRDLLLSLKARTGPSKLAVLRFPGEEGTVMEVAADFTSRLDKVDNLFYKLNMKGTTPTGPALLAAMDYMLENGGERSTAQPGWKDDEGTDGSGLLHDYIV